ncbi:hypothetical protein INN71_09405 [Nocardioides sp. ChNu-153]|uniref:hypothetical protein n=1 Tax=unclassified Nocardioides TaxID=2615069 RepID=UPI0024074D9E|nr:MULTISPECIES: hypothetical protein [unclassified Nocardioides]MDF9716215.1 hypothetical protein [Nocardioides sp. ChNu-99]MDN7121605.1 hypothetical protein [Nocardioides sp. ChNu-153]
MATVVAVLSTVPGTAHAAPAGLPVQIDDPRGDVERYPSSYGPSFAPAAPPTASDIAWVRARAQGDDVLVEVAVEQVFAYARRTTRSGQRLTLDVGQQLIAASYGDTLVSLDPDRTGTGFRVRSTNVHDPSEPWSVGQCDVDGAVAWSRVHDVVAVTIPGECIAGEDTTVSAGTFTVLNRVVAVDGRETSRSERAFQDSALP